MNLEDCLPADLRGLPIVKIGQGQSGAGVYRVGEAYVLKVHAETPPNLAILRSASTAGVAPRVVHVDDERRAVVSEHVADRGLMPQLFDPRTRGAALALIGKTLRRVHDLPTGGEARDPRALLAKIANVPVPAFVRDAIARTLEATVPDAGRAQVCSHNDVNPSNLVYDGERLLLLDWDAAGANEPFYDLATVAMFLRLDEPSCLALLSAHDGAAVTAIPPRFAYDRRLVAVLCGTMFLHLARASGYAGDANETRDAAPNLVDVYPRMRTGEVSLATPEGRWTLGLALAKEA